MSAPVTAEVVASVEAALGARVVRSVALSGGQVGRTARCVLSDGRDVVVKTAPDTPLDVEAAMLRYLAGHSSLPVPAVLCGRADLLVMRYVAGGTSVTSAAERHAGELLADLHGVHAERFGFERDTLLGPFPLANAWTASWPEFYAERRLRPLASAAWRAGTLPDAERTRVERLADSLPARFDADPPPSLIHGDVWGGNVLAAQGRIAAFLDPAIYFAHAEVELAFIDLFHTFGRPFYDAYQATRPIGPGYGRWRRDLYQVLPLLVHVALFGGAYLGGLRTRLERLGV